VKNDCPRERLNTRRIEGRLSRAILLRRGFERIDIILTDDRTISELAGRYRGRKGPTDVLSFSYPPCVGKGRAKGAGLAEIVISVDAARRQAAERGSALEDEILLLAVHGMLHAAGQGDEGPKDWAMMRKHEFETMMRIL
jgi:probable rRNA maturation factor